MPPHGVLPQRSVGPAMALRVATAFAQQWTGFDLKCRSVYGSYGQRWRLLALTAERYQQHRQFSSTPFRQAFPLFAKNLALGHTLPSGAELDPAQQGALLRVG